ncbi:hypothetical protein [Mesotoga sp. UBA6090]|uniref:hypothetical protein n=1 Tax=Mesotoga sp. UBA6090 TaxID=1946860 RepID=UPI0025E787CB|nr:hypothetical protein [Mesotoga sp. UBA6090]
MNILKKTDLDLERLNSTSWKWLNSEEAELSGGENSRQPQAMYFFTDEKNRSFCRRYNREVNFRRDVEDIGLCDKCGMRFRTYRAAQICVFAPAEAYYTIDTRDESKEIEGFPDKDFAEKGVSDFESKSWQ